MAAVYGGLAGLALGAGVFILTGDWTPEGGFKSTLHQYAPYIAAGLAAVFAIWCGFEAAWARRRGLLEGAPAILDNSGIRLRIVERSLLPWSALTAVTLTRGRNANIALKFRSELLPPPSPTDMALPFDRATHKGVTSFVVHREDTGTPLEEVMSELSRFWAADLKESRETARLAERRPDAFRSWQIEKVAGD